MAVTCHGPLLVLRAVFESAFAVRNLLTGIHKHSTVHMGKDAIYRFLRAPRHRWYRLMGFLDLLTGAVREKVLALNITTYDRSCSHKVELLSRVYDHCARMGLRRYRFSLRPALLRKRTCRISPDSHDGGIWSCATSSRTSIC